MNADDHLARQLAYNNTYEKIRDIPYLDLEFPRGLQSMHQIEITSRCNLRCVYCPSHKMPKAKDVAHLPQVYRTRNGFREQLDMTEAHFRRALEWATHFIKRGTQIELNLAGIGESTMHPQFIDFVRLAREAVGNEVAITLATNGLLVTEEMARGIQPYTPQVWVSLHRPEKAGPAIQILKRHGLYVDKSDHPATSSNNWGGQVDWSHTQEFETACLWQRHGFVMAMADGRITSCCLDAKGTGVIGHLDDAIPTVKQKPFDLCQTCHQHIRCKGSP
jgi:hypothetical protein